MDPEYQFVWSLRYIDSPICRDENKDADGDCVDGSDERLYYLTDANMNVTTLVDTGGDAVERYVYDPSSLKLRQAGAKVNGATITPTKNSMASPDIH